MKFKILKHLGWYNLSSRSGSSIKYIAVHFTAAQTPDAPHALNNCQYFARGDRQASCDFFLDNRDIYQYNPDPWKYYTWQVGDGKGKYGIWNRNTIGVEVCQQGDRPFTEAEIERLADLVQHLMATYNVPAERVVRHYDASRKSCPDYYARRQSEWNKLWRRIVGWDIPKPTPKPKPTVISKVKPDEVVSMIHEGDVSRFFNDKTGDHLITADVNEIKALRLNGWKDEGNIGATPEGMVIVYRLRNADTGEHFFTTSYQEACSILKTRNNTSDGVQRGWQFEGDTFVAYEANTKGHPIYRLLNPKTGWHLFTRDANEADALKKAGWKSEGVAFNLA